MSQRQHTDAGSTRWTRSRFDVFGRRMQVERRGDTWVVYLLGEGKRRPAEGIRLPPDTRPEEVRAALADLCHEWATPAHPDVRELDRED